MRRASVAPVALVLVAASFAATFAAAFAGTLTGCASQPVTEFTRTDLTGAVYDEDGVPVAGARVSIGRKTAVTDAFGRLRIRNLPRGIHTVRAIAPGFEPVDATVAVHSQTRFIRLRMWSVAGLVDLAIDALDPGSPERALAALARLEAVAPSDPRTRALRELVIEGCAP